MHVLQVARCASTALVYVFSHCFATQNGDDEIDWQEFAAVIKQAMEEALEQLEKEGNFIHHTSLRMLDLIKGD